MVALLTPQQDKACVAFGADEKDKRFRVPQSATFKGEAGNDVDWADAPDL